MRRPGRILPDLDVDETPERLLIRWKWRLSLAELGGFILCAGLVIAALLRGQGGPALIFSIVVIGLFAAALAYRVVAQLANRTEVRVDHDGLLIETRPVSLAGPRSLRRREIEQLYCIMLHSKYSTWYDLQAELASGERISLVSEVDSAERAFFLERAIERRLGIADRPVAGEVPRRP